MVRLSIALILTALTMLSLTRLLGQDRGDFEPVNRQLYLFDSTGKNIGAAQMYYLVAQVPLRYKNSIFTLVFTRTEIFGNSNELLFEDLNCASTAYMVGGTVQGSAIFGTTLVLEDLSAPSQTVNINASVLGNPPRCHPVVVKGPIDGLRPTISVPDFTNRYLPPFTVK